MTEKVIFGYGPCSSSRIQMADKCLETCENYPIFRIFCNDDKVSIISQDFQDLSLVSHQLLRGWYIMTSCSSIGIKRDNSKQKIFICLLKIQLRYQTLTVSTWQVEVTIFLKRKISNINMKFFAMFYFILLSALVQAAVSENPIRVSYELVKSGVLPFLRENFMDNPRFALEANSTKIEDILFDCA